MIGAWEGYVQSEVDECLDRVKRSLLGIYVPPRTIARKLYEYECVTSNGEYIAGQLYYFVSPSEQLMNYGLKKEHFLFIRELVEVE